MEEVGDGDKNNDNNLLWNKIKERTEAAVTEASEGVGAWTQYMTTEVWLLDVSRRGVGVS